MAVFTRPGWAQEVHVLSLINSFCSLSICYMPEAVTLLSVTCSDRELNHFTRQPCFSVSGDPPGGILP